MDHKLFPNGTRPYAAKHTKILATLGPASSKPEVMRELLAAGVNAFRLNCSHASMSELQDAVRLIRRTAEQARVPCSIVMDLQGPRLRVGRLRAGEPVRLRKGARLRITTHDVPGTENEISTNFKKLPQTVSKGSQILLDDGSIVLTVTKIGRAEVETEVVIGGLLKEHKGINLPGAEIDLPSLTQKDIRDFQMGIKLGIDHVALSFVRTPDDMHRARKMLQAANSTMRLIAKIEHPLALIRIHPILDAADGIMVARGDLAVELSPADVPAAQKQLVRKANEAGKLVIVATQMLESMIWQPNPTRAEASDVANAIYDGADVVMLSGETAVGQYPVEAVRMMSDIIRKAENSPFRYKLIPKGVQDTPERGFANALARAAHDACDVTGADAIMVYTLTGWSARVMSKYRPNAPIYALTPLKTTFNQLALYWGVTPVICPLGKTTDQMLGFGERILIKAGYLKPGETALITAGGTAKHKASNMLKIHVIGSLTLPMTGFEVAFVTAPDQATAEGLARGLVEAKLAACVNVLPGITSFYFWEGKLAKDGEYLLLIKTRASLSGDLMRFVKERHPYTVPEVISLPIREGLPEYLRFLERETLAR